MNPDADANAVNNNKETARPVDTVSNNSSKNVVTEIVKLIMNMIHETITRNRGQQLSRQRILPPTQQHKTGRIV